jgi:hypothetical protein
VNDFDPACPHRHRASDASRHLERSLLLNLLKILDTPQVTREQNTGGTERPGQHAYFRTDAARPSPAYLSVHTSVPYSAGQEHESSATPVAPNVHPYSMVNDLCSMNRKNRTNWVTRPASAPTTLSAAPCLRGLAWPCSYKTSQPRVHDLSDTVTFSQVATAQLQLSRERPGSACPHPRSASDARCHNSQAAAAFPCPNFSCRLVRSTP